MCNSILQLHRGFRQETLNPSPARSFFLEGRAAKLQLCLRWCVHAKCLFCCAPENAVAVGYTPHSNRDFFEPGEYVPVIAVTAGISTFTQHYVICSMS